MVTGWAGYILQEKLKSLKASIKNWPGYYAAGTSAKIKLLESDLQVVMGELELSRNTVDLRTKRLEIMSNLWKEFRCEESMWRQKSRVRWFKEGDKNSSFFSLS